MEYSNGFERYSNSWKKAHKDSVSQFKYSEKDINKFKMNKSNDFSKALNTSIVFDFVFKGLLVLGMVLLIWFYRTNTPIIATLVLLIGGSIYLLMKEYFIRKEFKLVDDLSTELSKVLKIKIQFYTIFCPKLKWMLASTNALFVWVGSMFYFYSKYGYYKIEGIEDIIVSAIMLTLAFGISFFAMTFQYKYYIHELKECLTQLSNEQTASMTMKKQLWRKRILIIVAILAIIAGVLVFSYIFPS